MSIVKILRYQTDRLINIVSNSEDTHLRNLLERSLRCIFKLIFRFFPEFSVREHALDRNLNCFCAEYYKHVPEAMILRSMDNSRQASCIEKPRSTQVLLSCQSFLDFVNFLLRKTILFKEPCCLLTVESILWRFN